MSTVLELVMLHTIDSCLIPRHLTESTIGAYLKKNLINRDIPITIIRLLVRWYGSQLYRVRWGDFFIRSFYKYPTNGVAQGGILSLRFQCTYIDDLSIALSNSKYGCSFGGCSVNLLFHADGMIILSPSANAL